MVPSAPLPWSIAIHTPRSSAVQAGLVVLACAMVAVVIPAAATAVAAAAAATSMRSFIPLRPRWPLIG
jgi:hypothetical protein